MNLSQMSIRERVKWIPNNNWGIELANHSFHTGSWANGLKHQADPRVKKRLKAVTFFWKQKTLIMLRRRASSIKLILVQLHEKMECICLVEHLPPLQPPLQHFFSTVLTSVLHTITLMSTNTPCRFNANTLDTEVLLCIHLAGCLAGEPCEREMRSSFKCLEAAADARVGFFWGLFCCPLAWVWQTTHRCAL